ncbi:MAG TPA: helix-turn-helix domain-containing protein [Polyangia bacterium]|nr:helix-turn-helix domain-containing protein [Polyangia bacterium]
MTVTAIVSPERDVRVRSTSDWRTVNDVCEAIGHDHARVRGPSRFQEDVEARIAVVAVLRGEFGWSYPRIGRSLGGRHHTSIMYLCGAVKRGRKKATAQDARSREAA